MRTTLLSFLLPIFMAASVRAADPVPPLMWPKVDADTARLVRDLGSPVYWVREQASKELKDRGPAAFPTLSLAVGATNDAEVMARTAWALPSTDPSSVSASARLAILEEKFAGAEEILREAMKVDGEGGVDYVALRALREGAHFDPKKELDDLRKLPLPENALNELGMYLYRAAGDSGRAAEFAARIDTTRKSWLSRSVSVVFVEASDYKALTTMRPEFVSIRMDPADPSRLPPLLAMRYSGNRDESDRLLLDFLKNHPATGPIYAGWIYIMLSNDHVEDCISFLKTHDEARIAFSILLYQLRLREALALPLDYSIDPAHLLVTMGFKQEAQKLLLRYKPDLSKAPEYASNTAFRFADELRFAGLPNEAVKYDTLGWKTTNKAGGKPAPTMPEGQYDIYEFWLGRHPNDADQASFEQVRKIIGGEVKPKLEVDFVSKALAKMTNLTLDSRRGQLQGVYHSLIHVGYTDIAKQLVEAWVAREKDPTPLSWLGDLALDENQPDAAFDYFMRAAKAAPTNALLMYKAGTALSRRDASKETGSNLMSFATFLALGSLSNEFDREMLRNRSAEEANRWLDNHRARFGDPAYSNINDRLARARQQAEAMGDFPTALNIQTQALFRPTRLVDSEYAGIFANVVLYHRLRALDALQRKDMVTLADALDKGLTDGPPDVELLEKTLPSLRAIDAAAADRFLNRAIARLTPVVQDYPDMALYSGQLARLQALSNRTKP